MKQRITLRQAQQKKARLPCVFTAAGGIISPEASQTQAATSPHLTGPDGFAKITGAHSNAHTQPKKSGAKIHRSPGPATKFPRIRPQAADANRAQVPRTHCRAREGSQRGSDQTGAGRGPSRWKIPETQEAQTAQDAPAAAVPKATQRTRPGLCPKPGPHNCRYSPIT